MVWQFQRFEGAPFLEDIVDRRIRFIIMFPTDILERCKSNKPEEYLKIFGIPSLFSIPNDFYQMIDPVFEFPECAIPHSQGYSLLFIGEDIIRGLTSKVKGLEYSNITHIIPKKVDYADFQDLKFIREYGARRIQAKVLISLVDSLK